MGEATKKGASHFFKKAHGLKNYIDVPTAGIFIVPAITLAIMLFAESNPEFKNNVKNLIHFNSIYSPK